MENKKALVFIFSIITIILGWTLFKKFDFENLRFENPWLAVVYSITFVLSVYIVLKNLKPKT